MVERRRPSGVLAEEFVKLAPEPVVPPRVGIGALKLLERGHDRLGHELSAEGSEVAGAIRKGRFSSSHSEPIIVAKRSYGVKRGMTTVVVVFGR